MVMVKVPFTSDTDMVEQGGQRVSGGTICESSHWGRHESLASSEASSLINYRAW